MSDLKIFSGRSNRPLAEKIAKTAGIPLGRIELRNFSDGEIWVKYTDNIRGDDVFIVQSTQPPADNLMELLMQILLFQSGTGEESSLLVRTTRERSKVLFMISRLPGKQCLSNLKRLWK